MIDRERIIKGLEQAKDVIERWIPIFEQYNTPLAIECAIALLKEKEAIEPEIEGGGSTWWYVCGECHGAIDKTDKFCRHCGKAVDWE